MNKLDNPRYERFARELVKQEAYESSHSRAKANAYVAAGFKASLEPADNMPAHKAACRLLRLVTVKARVRELRERIAMAHNVTEDKLIEELEEARMLAARTDQASAMVSATMGKARITGHVIERRETGKPGDFDGWSADDLRRYIATGQSPGESVDSAGNADNGKPEPLPEPTHQGPEQAQ